MELKNLIQDCDNALWTAAVERDSLEYTCVSCYVETKAGVIYIDWESSPIKGEQPVRVYVEHDDDPNRRESNNLEEYIEKHVSLDWEAADETVRENCQPYDEWNEHGFASATDYYEWRYG